MTELLYYKDAYIKIFEAVITGINEEMNGIFLDKTAFYPGGGGQLCDLGTIESSGKLYQIVKAKKLGDDIVHIIEGDLPKIGDQVVGTLDWERRHKLMRTHSAMHVLCGVMWTDFGCSVTGGNMEILSARMDFELSTLNQEMLPEIERRVNEEIKKEHTITSQILDREEAFKIPDLIRTKISLLPEGIEKIRTIEIANLDLQADGGTHVSNTNEIGYVSIVKFRSKGKINKRLYVEIQSEL
ncbi:MAG: alanyl-tRNA editing protein [Clostridiales bacterium]|nr:alanyl-tRNA editing protein [Clostridiales bacterium]